MSKQQKLIDKLKRRPRNFTFSEAESLLISLGFLKSNEGKTSGSRVKYTHGLGIVEIRLHRPHPQKELKSYQVSELLRQLEKEDLI